MEHGYIQHLAIMIYSFTEKQHPISMIYVITAGGIQSLVMQEATSEFCCRHFTFLITFFLAENISASHFSQEKMLHFYLLEKEKENHQVPLLTN